ncbi:hypothetical protein FHS85_003411 [Rhodoligotrophos appendicifer]|uniref:accessory factor UbiK family protein n=1 Tax=Rhodoligotrophos appendicifer TaxID=987056 RepID=UPI0011854F4E|nr:accessory factor UbiK family protein [Rhodoligotrophos appendicifer]
MNNPSSRIFDEMAKMFGTAASAAQGLRGEVDNLIRSQAERILGDLEVVQREEFDSVREMARLAREENQELRARIEALEKRLAEPVTANASRAAVGEPKRIPREAKAKTAKAKTTPDTPG